MRRAAPNAVKAQLRNMNPDLDMISASSVEQWRKNAWRRKRM
jgi:hypothetical protein